MRACVRSGMCCKQAPCPFGESISSTDHGCKHLIVDETLAPNVETYKCGIYDTIRSQRGAEISPAFGAGCCQPLFNTNRNAILTIRGKQGERAFVAVDGAGSNKTHI